MIRIPGARPIAKQKNTSKSGFKSPGKPEWNNRFVLEHIPRYNVMSDRFAAQYHQAVKKQKQVKLIPKGPAVIEPGRVRPSRKKGLESRNNSRSNLSEKRTGGKHTDIHITEEMLSKLKKELKDTWERVELPKLYRQVFEHHTGKLLPNQSAPILVKEIDDLKRGRAPIQQLLKGIESREECIKNIKELAKQMTEMPEAIDHNILNQCVEILSSLRFLSLNIVECSERWRQQLSYASLLGNPEKLTVSPATLVVSYSNQNYLLKMIIDTDFLASGIFSKYFNLQTEDPFLTEPAKQSIGAKTGLKGRKSEIQPGRVRSKREKASDKLCIPMAGSVAYRVNDASNLLGHEPEDLETADLVAALLHDQKFDDDDDGDSASERADGEDATVANGAITESTARENETSGKVSRRQSIEKENSNQDTTRLNKRVSIESEREDPEDSAPKKKLFRIGSVKLHTDNEEDEAKKVAEDNTDEVSVVDAHEYTYVEKGFALRGMEKTEEELSPHLNEYLEKLTPAMRSSFPKTEEMLKQAKSGYNFQWYEVQDSETSEVLGIVVFGSDPNSSLCHRTNLIHVSTIDEDNFLAVTEKVVELIWRKSYYKEIRVELRHFQNAEGKWELCEKVKEALTQELGFKWKNIFNDPRTGKRALIYGLPRPDDFEPSTSAPQRELIHLRASHVLSLSDKKIEVTTESLDKIKPENGFTHSCGLLNALGRNFKSLEAAELSSAQKEIVQIWSGLAEHKDFIFPAMVSSKKESLEEIEEEFKKFDMKTEVALGSTPSSVLASLKNVGLRWQSFDTFKYDVKEQSYNFLRVRAEGMMQVQCGSHNYPVFIVPTDDDNFNIVITRCQNYDPKKQSLEDFTNSLFKSFESVENDIEEIIFPAFEVSEKDTEFTTMNGLKMVTEDDKELFVQECRENFELTVISEVYPGNVKPSLDPKSQKFIQNDFIFGITHTKLEEA
eukprot:CAMPEP_0115012080 /NCGR_PEP_ID=MMETSP0216-20121206/24486_1 /TAXON_ID=223996 /ORGANISM="Protocruzia adherens, Strain Boccale" /LENGTH=955 /DNA_ID=CAMNT_0002380993 /DNA_START=143 /DNA_END=3006 /DNA_ORIENTATION=-